MSETVSFPKAMIGICSDEAIEPFCAELSKLGIQDFKKGYRAVFFEADESNYYKIHLITRYASRILTTVKSIPSGSDRILFDKARRIRWPDWFRENVPVAFEVYQQAKEHAKIPKDLAGSKMREALIDSFKHFTNTEPCIRSKDAKLKIIVFGDGNRANISLETSGFALHKRGYRQPGHPATLKETMAASILWHSGYDGSQTLVDFCCGSGTIVIEAALIAAAKAPGLLRARHGFGCEELKWFNYNKWREIQDELRQLQIQNPPPIFANDISVEFVDLAKKTASKAGVEKNITFSTQDLLTWIPPADCKPGIVVSNLPYGDRLESSEAEIQAFFDKLDQHLKNHYRGWRVALLAKPDSPWASIEMKPKRKIALSNGGIPVQLMIYDVYPAKEATI